MPIEIKMPALSPTMTEGNLARWLKREGEGVASGEVIAEIETDKATMEVEAVDEGRLGKILVAEGTEGVPVNRPIALLLEEGEDEAALESWLKSGGDNGGAESAPAEPSSVKPSPPPAATAEPRTGRPSTNGQSTNGHDLEAAKDAGARGRIFASPLARRLAGQNGLDLASIKGSGPHGRIVKADVERATKEGAAAPQAHAERLPPAAEPIGAAFDVVPVSSMRKIIARRLTESKQTIPHFYLTVDCRIDALLALRRQINEREDAKFKISVNDFVIKACALALKKVPEANASFGGDKIYRYRDIDISVAVAIPDGLITPIIRQADKKGMGAISEEMRDLAERAKAGRLKPEEFQGGGFSISNLGMYGVREFAAVINPPQACILAVGAGERRPIIEGNAVVPATMMTCTLSADHRVVDGVLGARLLKVIKTLIEQPLAMLL